MQEVLSYSGGIAAYKSEFGGAKKALSVQCKKCGCTKFHKWGRYRRNIVDENADDKIFVQRYRCVKCRETHSRLPSFCLRGIVYSADFVMKLLEAVILKVRAISEEKKRQAYIFLRRFVRLENLWLVFLRARGFGDFPRDEKERRAKIFTSLQRLYAGKEFAVDFLRETGRHFMAAK